MMDGRTAPRSAAMDTFRWGSGGTSLGEWEHTHTQKKDEKFVFSCNGFAKFTGVIFASRDNCPQGIKD